jgi:hypothetical protein
VTPGKLSCQVLKRTDVRPKLASQVAPNAIPSGVGYGPSQLQSAYNIASAAASSGGNATVALVDAFDYPSAASDLATYRSAAGLPAANFTKVNQNGQASPLPSPAPASDDWTLEEALDIDMVSAVCPNCHIVLVEAQDDQGTGLYTAENTAASMAGYISNSWGGTDDSSDSTFDPNFNHPGTVITASAGDSGFGAIYPATSRFVVSVGGTTLNTASNSRGWTESVWGSSSGGSGTGSGCSSWESKPTWQTDTGCSRRTDNDIAADADPSTGVAVYDTSNGDGGWNEVGGTSASSPMIAAMYALAGNAGSTPAQDIYQHTGNLFDVTSGADGSCSPSYLCTAGTGYDGPTGWGTPNGLAAFGGSGGGTGSVTVANPGNQTGTVGTAASLQLSASGGTAPYTWTATGLPTGLSISSSGLISGTPSAAGTFTVSATAKDSTGATGSTSFTWTISSSGGGGGCSSPGQKLGNPGFESGSTVWSSTPAVIGQNGPSEPAHSGTWDAWMDGYGTTHTDTISQSVTIPSGCSATLSFFLHIDTAETTTTTQFDTLTVKLGSTTLATFSNLNHASGYTSHSYNVSSLAGQTVTLTFTGTEDSSLQTSFVVDDTALTTS